MLVLTGAAGPSGRSVSHTFAGDENTNERLLYFQPPMRWQGGFWVT
ncbi:hypothetical protein BN1182_BZ_00270 [Pantoea ananatis]|nr:hypothetical protein BN1182_BZ_00270 [Pantoea ananatis]CRH35283.1 hypothetical protein BN1183_CF_00040 [Pantoea ananatis]